VLDVLDFILDFIRIDLIIGFGWYSIFFFILCLFKHKKEFIVEFDKNACKTVILLGILFVFIWLLFVTIDYFLVMSDEEKMQFIQRLTGKYSFGIWLQPLFWLILTQSLRINFVQRFLLFRLLIVIPFILTFERFVIILTSLHRDYLPSSWAIYPYLGFTWWEFLLSILVKTIEFCLIVFVYKYAKQWIFKFRILKEN
jgi:hypothetical protein